MIDRILHEPFALLGIFFLVVGFASLLFKIFTITAPANKHVNGNERGKQKSKKIFVFILITILAGVIAFIYWLQNEWR